MRQTKQSTKTQPLSNKTQPVTPMVALAGQTGGAIRVVLDLLLLLRQGKSRIEMP